MIVPDVGRLVNPLTVPGERLSPAHPAYLDPGWSQAAGSCLTETGYEALALTSGSFQL
jgi:hypothetical protein